ncbi:MAG TPA: lipid A-modifier LpxR family protein, partial [Usitatibacter sp.]|nr:lipid A-modifier LpxR family protein [Usitatibacter sp.]
MRRAVAWIAASVALSAAAQEDPHWYMQVDNDSFFGTDRWYSSGVRMARVQRIGDHALEFGVLQEIYTPEAKRFESGSLDRRPAGRLLLSAARHDYGDSWHQTVELAAGVRGPAAQGERVAEFIHRVFPARDVDWSRERPNELDVQLAAVRSHSFSQLRLHYGAVLGNELAFAHGGVEWRIGDDGARQMDSPLM